MRRVVVTGIGVVSSIGIGCASFWPSLLAGNHGFKPVSSFDTARYRIRVGAEIAGFDLAEHLPDLVSSGYGRATQFGLLAAHEAVLDAGLAVSNYPPERRGVAMGTTSGEPNLVETYNDAMLVQDLAQVPANFLDRYPCHQMPAAIASHFECTGITPIMIPAACAAGNYALAHAADQIRAGQVDVMLVGGSDAFSRITYTGFHRLGAIAPDLCRPFDKNRQGMIPGEGAGFLALENEEHALQRGAKIYAEFAGYGVSCDAYHMTGGHPDGVGAIRAMERALRESGVRPDQVSYISAHGTGTPSNDRNEVHSVKRVFGAQTRVPISSIKSMLGHTMGAASAIEAVTCCLAIRDSRIPPTRHLEEPDPECDLDFVPGEAREHEVEVAMSNAYAFGGTNASIILKKYRGSHA